MPTPMFTIPVTSPQQRRSDRVLIGFPVEVTAIDIRGECFSEQAKTTSVSRYGCCVLLTHRLPIPNMLQLRRLDTDEIKEARVVGPMSEPALHTAYGLEVGCGCDEFWGIRFSSPDERRQDGLRDGIYFVDRERKITQWSEGAEKLTGYKAAQTVGTYCHHNLLKHVDESGVPLCTAGCPLSLAMLDGKPRELDIFLQTSQGKSLPISVRTQPVRNSSGRIVGAVEVFSVRTIEPPALEKPLRMNPNTDPGFGLCAAAAAGMSDESSMPGWPTQPGFRCVGKPEGLVPIAPTK